MSHDAAANGAGSQEGTSRGKYWWLRWAIIGVAVVVLTVEVTLVWDQLAKAFHSLYAAKWLWVLAAVAAAMASMHSFAHIQRTLLRSAGVEVHQWRSEAAFYAGNALSTTMPGGPVLSATFMYRQQRMLGRLAGGGVLAAGDVGRAAGGRSGPARPGRRIPARRSESPFSLIFTLGGFIALLLLAQAVASRPDLIDGIGVRVLSWSNSLRGKPPDTGLDAWRDHLAQLESVSLSRRDLTMRSAGRCSTGSPTWRACCSPPTPPAAGRRWLA